MPQSSEDVHVYTEKKPSPLPQYELRKPSLSPRTPRRRGEGLRRLCGGVVLPWPNHTVSSLNQYHD